MINFRTVKQTLFVVLVLFITGCGPTADFVAEDYKQPNNLAVLPVINNTVDMKAGEVLRSVSYVNLYNYQYAEMLEIAKTDSLLREFGITDGGQLASVDIDEIYDVLKSDGLLVIELKDARYGTAGAKRENRILHADYTLYSNGKEIYAHDVKVEKKSSTLVGGLLGAAMDPVGALTDRAVDTAVKGLRGIIMEHELLPEMDENFNEVIQTLPGEIERRSRSERI